MPLNNLVNQLFQYIYSPTRVTPSVFIHRKENILNNISTKLTEQDLTNECIIRFKDSVTLLNILTAYNL